MHLSEVDLNSGGKHWQLATATCCYRQGHGNELLVHCFTEPRAMAIHI